jgi:hypothetical protein
MNPTTIYHYYASGKGLKNPHEMVPTSTKHIKKVIDNLHMLWMVILIWIHHHVITNTLVGSDLKNQLKSCVNGDHQMIPL